MKQKGIAEEMKLSSTGDKIMEAAVSLFMKNGYKRTTTAAIAKKAGVNEVTIFRTFGNKKALFHEVFTRMTPGPERISYESLRDPDELIPNLEYLLRSYMVLHILHLPVSRMSLQAMDDLDDQNLNEVVGRKRSAMMTQLRLYFEQLRADGVIIDMDYEALTGYLFTLFQVKAPEFLQDKKPGKQKDGAEEEQYDKSRVDYFAKNYATLLCTVLKQ